jgi:DNA-binding transcriptional LysR family regulator
VLSILGLAVDRILRDEAPAVGIRYVPNTPEDAELLRDNESELAVGIYGELPQEMRSRLLLTDRFVCVVRKGHPMIGKSFGLAQFVALQHIQVAPRGRPGGYVDDVLRQRGLSRTVARAVPYFLAALQLTAETDYVLTISERIAKKFADALHLHIMDAPLSLRPYGLSLLWHPRVHGDPSHRFLRQVFVRAAREIASDRHDEPRVRLDTTDPTSRPSRWPPKSPR